MTIVLFNVPIPHAKSRAGAIDEDCPEAGRLAVPPTLTESKPLAFSSQREAALCHYSLAHLET